MLATIYPIKKFYNWTKKNMFCFVQTDKKQFEKVDLIDDTMTVSDFVSKIILKKVFSSFIMVTFWEAIKKWTISIKTKKVHWNRSAKCFKKLKVKVVPIICALYQWGRFWWSFKIWNNDQKRSKNHHYWQLKVIVDWQLGFKKKSGRDLVSLLILYTDMDGNNWALLDDNDDTCCSFWMKIKWSSFLIWFMRKRVKFIQIWLIKIDCEWLFI